MDQKYKIWFLQVIFVGSLCLTAVGQPQAEKGVLDLRKYNLSEEGILQIQGEWNFYWGKLIDPISHVDSTAVCVPVPSAWGQLSDIIPEIEPIGFGTYTLKILLPEKVETIVLRFEEVFSASGYYVNGRNVGFKGLPGSNRYQSVFGYTPSMFVVPVKDTLLDLVVHVSNFEHRSGGMRGDVELGTPMQIMADRAERKYRDYFLMGAFFIIGIYFMALFQARSDMYKLFFSLICLVMAFRIYILSDTDLQSFDWITEISRLRLEYLSFDLLVPLFVLMVRFVFPHDFPKLWFRVILYVCLLIIIIVIFMPVPVFTATFTYYMYFVVFAGAVILYSILTAWKRGRYYAQGFAAGIIIVVVGAVNDMFFIAGVIETGLVSHYTMFTFLLIYAIIFSRKINRGLLRNERLSDEILQMNENLELLVDKRTRELSEKSEQLMMHREELRKSNEELQREVYIRNRFISIMGHDIRGPLGYTNQGLELILKGALSKEDEQEMLKLTAENSRRLLNLLENLLFWGRCQTGEVKSMAIVFRPATIMQDVAELYQLPLAEKGIELFLDVPDNLKVYADMEHVKLIIRNLLANAIKYTNDGGEIRLRAVADHEAEEAVLEVADNGIGMEEDVQKNLFTSQFVTSTTGTSDEKGTGFGLKLCRELVELNNGTISVKSEIGKGSRFFVRLPLNT